MSYSRRRILKTLGAASIGWSLAACNRLGSAPSKTAGKSDTLYLYTWNNYTDPTLTDAFTQATGIKVIVDIFDANETLMAKLQAGGGDQYSVIYPSDFVVTQMAKAGLIAALDPSRLTALKGLFPNHLNPSYDPKNQHSVPVIWGTTGLAYNPQRLKDLGLPDSPQDWDYLWKHKDALKGQITLLNDAREVIGLALKSLGHSYNTQDLTQIQAAVAQLKALKPSLASFTTDGWRDPLVAGDLAIAMTYSSDALNLLQSNPKLNYVIPRSGSILWTDTMAIPTKAPNPDAAYQWLNFVMQPDIAAAASQRLQFATSSQLAYEKLPPALRQKPTLYPAQAILDKCEVMAPLPQDLSDRYDKFWTELTI